MTAIVITALVAGAIGFLAGTLKADRVIGQEAATIIAERFPDPEDALRHLRAMNDNFGAVQTPAFRYFMEMRALCRALAATLFEAGVEQGARQARQEAAE
jgi:hypothetical protein